MAEQAIANDEWVSGGRRHQDAVIEALTVPTRVLIGAVLVINFSLGLWLVRQSDFSGVKPQGFSEAQPGQVAAPELPQSSRSSAEPMVSDTPILGSSKVALNEAN